MKKSELRQLIKEEIRKILNEEIITVRPEDKFKVKYNDKTWSVMYHNHEEGESINLVSGKEKIQGTVTRVTPNGTISIKI